MTDPTPVAPRSPRDELRVQLLLHLPELALRVERAGTPAGVPSTEFPELDLYDRVQPDHDYDPTALAAFVMAEVDRLVSAAGVQGALAQAEGLEAEQAEIIQLAGASSTFAAMAEWHSYLGKLAPILQRNLNLTEQWDLARTLQAEAERVRGVLVALLDRFPQMAALLGDEVGRRAQGLVDEAGRDL